MERMQILLLYTAKVNETIPTICHILESQSCNNVRHQCAHTYKQMEAFCITTLWKKRTVCYKFLPLTV